MPNLARLFQDFLQTAPTDEIADFYEYKKRMQLQPEQPAQPTFPRGTLLPPNRPRAPYPDDLPPLVGTDAGSMPQYDTSDLPQVAPPPPDPLTARIANQRQRTRELSDPTDPRFQRVRNNDRGAWGRLGDILRQFIVSAGQTYNSTDPRLDPRQRLATALGGGIAGGFVGGFHPQIDEERQRMYDIQVSRQKESDLLEQQKLQQSTVANQLKTAKQMQELALGQPVQVLDPITGQTVAVRGSEAYSQGQQSVRQQAGFENQRAHQGRQQDFQRIENAKTRENNWQIAVASAQTAADKNRIENQIQADRDHEANVESYFRRKSDRLLEIAKLAGSVGGTKLMFDTTLTQARANLDRAQDLNDQIFTESSKGSSADRRLITNLTRQRDALIKQVDDANQKLAAEAGKAGVNASQLEALRKADQEDRYPTKRDVPSYRPTVPQRPGAYSAQGKVYPSPSALRGAFPGLTDEQIRQRVEAAGGKFQN